MGEWLLAAEAAAWLALAGLGVRVLSFARLARFAASAGQRDDAPEASPPAAIGRAVEAAARRAPWPVLCFEKGLAAHAMLRRRGRPSILYYGGRNDASLGLTAHVWVELDGAIVVGAGAAPGYAVLAAFPFPALAERARA